MTDIEYALRKLAEEAAEVAQMAIKCLNFGLQEVQPGRDETNFSRLAEELSDLDFYAEKLEFAMETVGISTEVTGNKDRQANYEKYRAISENNQALHTTGDY